MFSLLGYNKSLCTFVFQSIGFYFCAYGEYKLRVGWLLTKSRKLIWKVFGQLARLRLLVSARLTWYSILMTSFVIQHDTSNPARLSSHNSTLNFFFQLFNLDYSIDYHSKNKYMKITSITLKNLAQNLSNRLNTKMTITIVKP